MRSGKGKRKQMNQKGADDDDDTGTEKNQEQHTPGTQQCHYDGHQLSENDGDDERDGDEEQSDDVGSQRSWSPVIKPRRRFTASEIQFLEAEYAQDINPSTDQLKIIAQTIGTTRRIITTWFQNHRAKGKRNNSNGSINKNKKQKHVHAVTTKNNKSRARKNLTQAEMIGSTPGPSCVCINQTTADDDYHHPIFSANSTSSGHAAVSGTVSPLDMSDPSLSTLNTYDTSYFVPNPTIDITVPPTTATTLNHTFYPTMSSSNYFNTWSQPPSAALPDPGHYLNTPPPSLMSHPTLPQCCVDELYTGYPCPFHTLYL